MQSTRARKTSARMHGLHTQTQSIYYWCYLHEKVGTGFRVETRPACAYAQNMQSVHAKRARKENEIGGNQYLTSGELKEVS